MSDLAGARSRESDPRGALSGVAGGELLIPTIVLLYGVDIKLRQQPVPGRLPAHHAGGVRPLQPRPGLRRVTRQRNLRLLHGRRVHQRHLARGSLLGVVSNLVLIPILALILPTRTAMGVNCCHQRPKMIFLAS